MSNFTDRIQAFNQGRHEQRLSIKYQMMRDSRFAFMRATCHLYFEDWPRKGTLNEAPAAWIAGDLHPENFAIYRGEDDQIYLDINDFDEAILAPCVWDVTRFVSSIQIAFTDFTSAQRKQIAQRFIAAYVEALAADQIRSIQPDAAPPDLSRWMLKQAKRKREKFLNSYSVLRKKKRKFKLIKDKTYPLTDAEQRRATDLFSKWNATQSDATRYRVVDITGRLAGISSIGLERYIFLIQDSENSEDNRLIELKQRIDSALTPFVSIKQPDWANPAARVVSLQTRLQAVPPAPLDVITKGSTSFTVRELQPVQEKLGVEQFNGLSALREAVDTLGKLTAWAHLRGSGRQGAAPADDLMAFAAQSTWQAEVLRYGLEYAKQIVSDYETFCKSSLGKMA